jgi:hypothetical protein
MSILEAIQKTIFYVIYYICYHFMRYIWTLVSFFINVVLIDSIIDGFKLRLGKDSVEKCKKRAI